MKLQPRHRRAIAALMTGTVEDAAEAVNVTPRTIYNWKADPDFARELESAQSEGIANAAGLMAGGVEQVVRSLIEVLNTSTDNREIIAACRVYLSALPNIRLLGSIEAKLSRLLGEDSDDNENLEAS